MHNKTFQIIILIYLLFSFCVPSTLGILKRRTISSSSVSTALWDVSITPDINNSLQLTPNGSDGSYTLTVTNDSEVDVEYQIVVSNIPSGVQVKLDNGYYQQQASTVTFDNAGTIDYDDNDGYATHTLYFRANSGATTVNNQSVTVDVIFKQNL